MSQSYIGEKYDNFFEKMLNRQRENIISKPVKQFYTEDSSNYVIIVAYKNSTISYSFTSKNECIYIYQFIPIENQETIEKYIKELIELNDNNYTKENNYWIEYKRNFKIKHTIKENINGIITISEKL